MNEEEKARLELLELRETIEFRLREAEGMCNYAKSRLNPIVALSLSKFLVKFVEDVYGLCKNCVYKNTCKFNPDEYIISCVLEWTMSRLVTE